ncbi:MAG: TrkH family potassium uptake protein, partial [Planctomycetales bacterium]
MVAYLLGIVTLLIGAAMPVSLPWAWFPTDPNPPATPWSILAWRENVSAPWKVDPAAETQGVIGLGVSIAVCLAVGAGLMLWGRGQRRGQLLRKEAMAVVGLSWVLATVLGALPFLLSQTGRGMDGKKPIRMTVADALFESQSGFSTTGATVLTNIENIKLVPRCILFWRSVTHFLGGLGIIVLFVAVLGQGSAGKALMRAEMPGPTKDVGHAKTQYAAIRFAKIYIGLNFALAVLLWVEGMHWFAALCHALGTLATGGFSTYDTSLGYFNSPLIESTVLLFMILA